MIDLTLIQIVGFVLLLVVGLGLVALSYFDECRHRRRCASWAADDVGYALEDLADAVEGDDE